MKTYKKTIISILIILSLFILINGVSANDLNNKTSTTLENNHKVITSSDMDKSTIMTHHNMDTNEKTNHDTEKKSKIHDEKVSDTNIITNNESKTKLLDKKSSNDNIIPIKKSSSDRNSEDLLGDSDTIYVAPNDNFEFGDGSASKPYASIKNAVNTAKTKSGKIIIKEGTYHENGIIIDGDKQISIIGEGQIVIDNADLKNKTIFTVKTKNLIIKNIIFRNNQIEDHGSAFNIVGESQTNPLEVNIRIENCSFENLEADRGSAIYAYNSKGNINIINSNFTKSNANRASICIQQSADTGGLNLKIDGSKFADNHAYNTGALYISQAATISITNSIFYNNTAKASSGAMYLNNCSAIIDKCLIYNNTATNNPVILITRRVVYNTGYDDDSSTPNNPIFPTNAIITNCIIENNTPTGSKVPVIRLETSNLNISYSSLVNGFDIENTVKENYGTEKLGNVTANNNWWGTDDPYTKVSGSNIQIDNWITMNININASMLESGDKVNVIIDFNHVKTKTGEIKDLTGWIIPKIYNVNFKADNGLVNLESLKMKYGEVKNIIYTANVVPDTLSVNCDGLISQIKFKDKSEPYYGTIYVSKSGNDNNDGSIEYPIASISKAIELASLDGASGEIIINSGTYTGSNYEINKNLTISGHGTVILDAEGLGRIIKASSDVSKLLLANLTLKNGKQDYGAAIYSYASKTILDNITLIGANSVTGSLILANYDLSINNSKIYNHNGGDVVKSSGHVIINNSLFENNLVNTSSSDFGIIYMTSSFSRNLIVENSRFINNIARQGVIHGSSKADINVKDSVFINNINLISNGGAIYADQNSKLNINNSTFINNRVTNSDHRNGGAISILAGSEASINKSVFINNSANDNGDAIYNKGKLTINYSVLLTNNTNKLIFNENSVNAQFNWWGTNNDPKNLVSNNVDSSNWVIMSVNVPDEVNNIDTFTVDFKHYQTSSTIKELNSNIPELRVKVDVVNGSLDKSVLDTINNLAKVTYTVTKDGYDSVSFSSSDVLVTKVIKTNLKQDNNAIVTKDNIDFYFDTNGYLNPSISSKELVFTGEFKNLNFIINRPINITGRDALFNNTNIIICADNVNLTNIRFICDKLFEDTYCVIYITESNDVLIKNNTINYNAPNGESYVIYAENSNKLKLNNNIINYTGRLDEYSSTITVYISESEDVTIKNNNITSNIPSIPLGELIRTAGLLIEDSLKINLESNNINVNYNSFEGDKDTLYAVDLSYSTNMTISKNNIQINGHDYSYGLILIESDDALISMNNINAHSILSQANGLDISNYKDISGLRKYTIEYNNITSSAKLVVYPINFSDIEEKSDAIIDSNNIKGEAKFVYGVFIQGHETLVQNNDITVKGNYTSGLISSMTDLTIIGNIINSTGSNIGDDTGKHPSEIVKAETNSIILYNAKIDIRDNILSSSGDYTIDLIKCNGVVKNNNLRISKGISGDLTIRKTEDSDVEIDNNKSSIINETGDINPGHNNTGNNTSVNNTGNNTETGNNTNTTIPSNQTNTTTPINTETGNNTETNNTTSNPDQPGDSSKVDEAITPKLEKHTGNNDSSTNGETGGLKDNIKPQKQNKSNKTRTSDKRKKGNKTPLISLTKIKSPKSISKKSKKLVISVKLKIKNKIAKKKKVTFIFNNGKYKVKTNKKGIAKLVIKKAKLKKLLKKVKVGKKLKYKIKYGKKTVTKKILIKN